MFIHGGCRGLFRNLTSTGIFLALVVAHPASTLTAHAQARALAIHEIQGTSSRSPFVGEVRPRVQAHYEAYLEEGNDPGGIDVGFLVDRARVEVLQVTQEGRADSFRNPVNGRSELLNDRPPLVLLPASLALVASVP